MAKTNPNKANQYKLDPRSADFLALYLDPESETYSNALQSALKAGYAQEYAESITAKMPTWLAESIGDHELVKKAIGNLKALVDFKGDRRLNFDVSRFVLEKLYKQKFSTDKEAQQAGVTINVLMYQNGTPNLPNR